MGPLFICCPPARGFRVEVKGVAGYSTHHDQRGCEMTFQGKKRLDRIREIRNLCAIFPQLLLNFFIDIFENSQSPIVWVSTKPDFTSTYQGTSSHLAN
jgi:hypothetical protein